MNIVKMESKYSFILENKIYYSFLLGIAIFFFICNYYTPLIQDDYAYCYIYGPDSAVIRPTSMRINSLIQVFISQINHYIFVNGRITSHVLIQIFCGLLGKSIFNVVNTMVFVLFLDSMVRISTHNKRNVYILLLVYISFLVVFPNPGQTFFWLSGSCNYLWSITFSLLVIRYILFTPFELLSKNKIVTLLLGVVGLLIGCMNESITLGIAGGLFFYFVFHKEKFRTSNKSFFIGYLLGVFVILVSPGSWSRLQSSGMQSDFQIIPFFFSRTINMISVCFKLVLPLVAFFLFIYRIRLVGLKQEAKDLFFWVFIVLSCFLFLLGMGEERIFLGLSVVSGIVILQEMAKFLNYKIIRTLVITCCLIVIPVYSYKAYSQINKYYSFNKEVINSIKSSPKECVVLYKEYLPQRFVYATVVNNDRYDYHNRVRAFYYDKEYIQALPKFLYEKRKASFFLQDASRTKYVCENDTTKCLYTLSDEPYWIFPLSPEFTHQNKVYAVYHFLNKGNEPLAFHQKVVRSLLGTLTPPEIQKKPVYCITTVKGDTYLILPKEENIDSITVFDEVHKMNIISLKIKSQSKI